MAGTNKVVVQSIEADVFRWWLTFTSLVNELINLGLLVHRPSLSCALGSDFAKGYAEVVASHLATASLHDHTEYVPVSFES